MCFLWLLVWLKHVRSPYGTLCTLLFLFHVHTEITLVRKRNNTEAMLRIMARRWAPWVLALHPRATVFKARAA